MSNNNGKTIVIMKFTKVFLLSAATTLVASLSSCTDNDLGFTANSIQFEKNFVERFGNIDPNQNWGFEELPVVNTRGVKTRAEGYIEVNRNQWAEKDENGNYKDYSLVANNIEIPGWPNFDGYYYYSGSDGATLLNPTTNMPDNGSIPAGDITAYEIEYVSRWFREHPNPESIKLDLTDFFIQNVSKDHDRVISDAVYNGEAIGKNLVSGTCNGPAIVEVPNGKGDGGKEGIDFKLDQLNLKALNGVTHNYNFNASQTPDMAVVLGDLAGSKDDQLKLRQAQYLRFEGVYDFWCENSFGEQVWDNETQQMVRDGKTVGDWVLVKLEWDEKGLDNQMHHRTGYYLAFDYSAYKGSSNTEVKRDGFYSNWIIKITPAFHKDPVPVVARVMCEDLGTTDDFDFNDVVFDVWYDGNPGNYTAHITVQAAGGTLPLYIGDKSHEVHAMFGVSTKTMINTDKFAKYNSEEYPTVINKPTPSEFTITGLTTTNPRDIPVIVTHSENNDKNALDIELKAETGKAPQKFCVPVYVTWANERVRIEDAYPYFTNWVGDRAWTCAVGQDPTTFKAGDPLKTRYDANIWFSPAGDDYFNGTNLYDPESMKDALSVNDSSVDLNNYVCISTLDGANFLFNENLSADKEYVCEVVANTAGEGAVMGYLNGDITCPASGTYVFKLTYTENAGYCNYWSNAAPSSVKIYRKK